jgi:site-specific recombinase
MHVDNSAEKILRLLTEVSSDETEITKLSSLFDNSASLLIHQISEHNSEYGEKYTGGSKEDYKWIWKAGAVGGLIVGFLGILKPLLASLMLPPLVEATAYGFMYSFIFLAIYFLGGVLATKQPAMTAARLASAIDGEGDSEEALLKLSELFTNIFRIQITATLANAIFAFPAAYLVAFVFSKISLVDSQLLQADYLVESLHPLASNTLFYAFLTGIALAVSGLFGGLMMNWFNFENIEQRLKHYYAPGSFWNRKAESIGKRMSGVSSNVCLGMLLGLFSELGYLLGLPFDVRHITFASSQIGTSLGSGYQPDDPNVWIWLLISVALIGAINLVVSFFVTIWTIFKSRKIEIRMLSTLFKYIGKRFLRNPFTFFLPIGLRKRSETLSECTW